MNTTAKRAYQSIDPKILLAAVKDDTASFYRLLQTFLRIAPPMLEQLQQAAHALDVKAIHHHSHSLKGTSMLIGAAGLVRMLQNIESQAQNTRDVLAACSLDQVQEEFERVCAEVQRCLQKPV